MSSDAGLGPHSVIARVCAAVEEDLDKLVRDLVTRIRSVVPAYSGVAFAEQYDYIHAEFRIMLDCLAQGAALPEELVGTSRELGRRRAQQGMTLPDVVQSYHLGLKAIWAGLVQHGSDAGPALLDASSYLWDNVHVLTSAVAEGHTQATRSAQALRAGMRYRVLEALSRGVTSSPADLDGLVTRLGWDAAGDFTAVVAPAEGWNELDVESFQSLLERECRSVSRGRDLVHCSRVGELVVTLTQVAPTDLVVPLLRERASATPLGVGMTRSGLDGAAASIQDARLAMVAAAPGEVVDFEADWMTALLAAHPEQGTPLLASGLEVARSQTHLAEAVLAYAQSGFAISVAARALHLHANSVTYRLERWEELTGWNPRTFTGLLRSVAALRLARLADAVDPSTARRPT